MKKDYIKIIDVHTTPSIEAQQPPRPWVQAAVASEFPDKKVCPCCGSKLWFYYYENGSDLLKCEMCDKIYNYDEKYNFPTKKEYQRIKKLERIIK